MRSLRRLSAGSVVLALAVIGLVGAPAQAIEVLVNGGLEIGGGGPASWDTTESITGDPTAPVTAFELRDAGNNPPPPPVTGLGMALATWSGNEGTYANQNKMVNVVMTQTVTATAGKTYTLNGDALLQQSSSSFLTTLGVVPAGPGDYNQNLAVDAADYTVWRDTLGQTGTGLPADGDASGTVDQADYDLWKTNFGHTGHGVMPSPTNTFFKVEFLDGPSAGANVLGSQMLDLRTDPTTMPDVYQTHTFTTAAAPVGTTNARVTAAALNMVQSCGADCTGGHDVNFDNFSLVQNGIFGGQKLTNGNLDIAGAPVAFTVKNSVPDNFQFSNQSFANYDIAQMMGVAGQTGLWLRAFNGGDVTITQTVPGVVGDHYTFSAWSKWEVNYRGADPSSATQDFLKIEFLDGPGDSANVLGSQMLDLRNVQVNDNTWRQISMAAATAPAGTTNVRVSAITTGMVMESGPSLSAFYDNFSLIQTGAGAAVPEPSSLALFGIALGMIGVWRWRG